jgi:hypothetical protein
VGAGSRPGGSNGAQGRDEGFVRRLPPGRASESETGRVCRTARLYAGSCPRRPSNGPRRRRQLARALQHGDPAADFETALTERLAAPDVGFERDAKQSFKTDRFQITHYDASEGYLVRNVMAVRALTATADHPTLSIITYRVDYSWLRSISH